MEFGGFVLVMRMVDGLQYRIASGIMRLAPLAAQSPQNITNKMVSRVREPARFRRQREKG